MATLTEKQNFMTVINGGVPEWVPRYTFGPDPYATKPLQTSGIMTSWNGPPRRSEDGGFIDMWGVEYVSVEEVGGAALPVPDKFLLDDIRKWRDVIKAPDISEVNWELVAKRDLENLRFDPAEVAVTGGGGGGFFLPLMNFMGFNNGLVAYYEEPEEVKALYEYMLNFYLKVSENVMNLYPIDIFTVGDDAATAYNPFISPEMYREFIKPYTARLAKRAYESGMPIMMHCCGRCEDFIDDWMDYGVNSWNPAQITNDLVGIKEKYGNKMVLVGCWDSSGPAGWDDCTEELMRSEVRRVIDTFAPGGGFMFLGSTYGPEGDERLANRRQWMTSEYEAYRETPYK